MQAHLKKFQQKEDLEFLQKIVDNAIKDEKFRLLKSSNETVQKKVLQNSLLVETLKLIGFIETIDGLIYEKSDVKPLEITSEFVSIEISNFKTPQELEYEKRKEIASARALEVQKKKEIEEEKKLLELKKIKSIQEDVRERPVLASQADETMGRSSAAIGIFAGAGGKSSTAKTFKDIGVNLN